MLLCVLGFVFCGLVLSAGLERLRWFLDVGGAVLVLGLGGFGGLGCVCGFSRFWVL